jgi:hypothetical protein
MMTAAMAAGRRRTGAHKVQVLLEAVPEWQAIRWALAAPSLEAPGS